MSKQISNDIKQFSYEICQKHKVIIKSFGMLFFADIQCFETELHNEIEKIAIMDEFPKKWIYPDIQPHLINEATRLGYL